MDYLRTMFTYIGLGPDKAPPRAAIEHTSMAGTPEDVIKGLNLVKRLGIDKVLWAVVAIPLFINAFRMLTN